MPKNGENLTFLLFFLILLVEIRSSETVYI